MHCMGGSHEAYDFVFSSLLGDRSNAILAVHVEALHFSTMQRGESAITLSMFPGCSSGFQR